VLQKAEEKGKFKHEGQSLERGGEGQQPCHCSFTGACGFFIPFPMLINDYTLPQNLSFGSHFCTFNAASKSGASKESVKAGIKPVTRQKVDIKGD